MKKEVLSSLYLLIFISIFLLIVFVSGPEISGQAIDENSFNLYVYSQAVIIFLIVFIAFTTIVLTFLAYKLSRRLAKQTSRPRTQKDQSKEKILEYIRQSLDKGADVDKIESNLLKQGWPKNFVKEALNGLI